MKDKINTMIMLILLCVAVVIITINAENLAFQYYNYYLLNKGF